MTARGPHGDLGDVTDSEGEDPATEPFGVAVVIGSGVAY
jgi:hypothetical protein